MAAAPPDVAPKFTAEIIEYWMAHSYLRNTTDSKEVYSQRASRCPEPRAATAGPMTGTRIAQLIDGSIAITMESSSRRVLSILRCAAGADHGLDRRHPEVRIFARALIDLPNDQRPSQLTGLFAALQHHLPAKQRDMVRDHIGRMNAAGADISVINRHLGELQVALDEALNALYPSKWLASEVKAFIESEMRDEQDAMARALNIFRSATGVAIPVNTARSETLRHARLLSDLRAEERLEYIRDLYGWLRTYLTLAQRRDIENYLASAGNAASVKTCPSFKKFQTRLQGEWQSVESQPDRRQKTVR
ncbi:hypothetical protein GCM10023165_12830 [Variovorax defluvii]|uniref:Uncharacterized protein n=1 Tax=Variovorax defluvii TaxID=913761 RepID=A0ABP8H962_9BURK